MGHVDASKLGIFWISMGATTDFWEGVERSDIVSLVAKIESDVSTNIHLIWTVTSLRLFKKQKDDYKPPLLASSQWELHTGLLFKIILESANQNPLPPLLLCNMWTIQVI